MSKRRAISKKVRFEVFKRDSFSCQYCGKSAPEVLLQVDHINPVAKGGTNDLVNLLTSCSDCNSGKGATALDDNSVAAKQMRQLKELNERREQIRLIAKWREGMVDLVEEQIKVIDDKIYALCKRRLTDIGKSEFRKSLKKYGLEAILVAMETSADQYLDTSKEETVGKFVNYTHRICFWNQQREKNPEVDKFSLICGMANKRWWTCNKSNLWRIVKDAYYNHNVSTEDMIELVRESSGIMAFERGLSDLIEAANG